jgi:hypothetical protein
MSLNCGIYSQKLSINSSVVMLFVQQNWALGVRYLHLNMCILYDYYKHLERLQGSLGIINHFHCYFFFMSGTLEMGRGMLSWHAQGLTILFLPLVYEASACNHGNVQTYT